VRHHVSSGVELAPVAHDVPASRHQREHVYRQRIAVLHSGRVFARRDAYKIVALPLLNLISRAKNESLDVNRARVFGFYLSRNFSLFFGHGFVVASIYYHAVVFCFQFVQSNPGNFFNFIILFFVKIFQRHDEVEKMIQRHATSQVPAPVQPQYSHVRVRVK
jgi:hypothetical protein